MILEFKEKGEKNTRKNSSLEYLGMLIFLHDVFPDSCVFCSVMPVHSHYLYGHTLAAFREWYAKISGGDVLLPNETSAFMDTVQWERGGVLGDGTKNNQQKAEIWTFERIFCVAALRGDILLCESLSSSHKLFSHCDGNFQLVYLALVCHF